ncbi:MAG: bifunctional riboflavin kinase/FAD synthetase, partial [Bacteroidales bacterium]|nr:bifunctional riboflavin kinase/FAD synthetase [Bacteroidales bacterium]
MILHCNIEKFSARNPVVTVGIFDGVHLGHRFILKNLREAAQRLNGESVLVTLWPHPRTILNQTDDSFRLLNTMDEKIRIMEEEGLDHLVVIPFTESFSRLSSCDFVKEFLVEKIGIRHLVVGYNHRFGHNREGDFGKLKECAGEYGFGIEKLPPLEMDEGKISSSEIRECLLKGDVRLANKLLGWLYSFAGEVVGGSRLGTSIGFPTANITPEEENKLLPADGVYAVLALLKGKSYKGMMNMGSRPTVNKDPDKKSIEVHLIDFEENIYREKIEVQFVTRLREERRFSDIE